MHEIVPMKSQEAIRLLRQMKAELDSFTVHGVGSPRGAPLYWLRKVHGYADQFFEKGSDPHIMLGHIRLTLYGNIGPLDKQHREAIAEAKSRIDHCVDFIQRFGLYKPPRKNVVVNWSNGLILAILGVIGTGIFLAGKSTSDVNAIEVRQELRFVRDSLRTAVPAQPAIVVIHDTIWVPADPAKVQVPVPMDARLNPKP